MKSRERGTDGPPTIGVFEELTADIYQLLLIVLYFQVGHANCHVPCVMVLFAPGKDKKNPFCLESNRYFYPLPAESVTGILGKRLNTCHCAVKIPQQG